MNRVVIVGRLVKDTDLRKTNSGKAVGNFTLAVNRPFKNQQGEQEADFIRCQVWGKAAENLANYMGKGSQVGVDGRIQTRSFDGQDGKKVYVTEVVADSVQFLESKNQSQNQSQQNQAPQQAPPQQAQQPNLQNQGVPISDQDLPF